MNVYIFFSSMALFKIINFLKKKTECEKIEQNILLSDATSISNISTFIKKRQLLQFISVAHTLRSAGMFCI